MTNEQREVIRRTLAGFSRQELLAVRQDVDEMLGYVEFRTKLLEEGIVL
jgi:hypothetical protein